MTANAAFLARSYPIGPRYRCLFTSPLPRRGAVMALSCEWTPHPPRRMSPQVQAAYAVARNAFLVDLMDAAGIGGAAAVVEV